MKLPPLPEPGDCDSKYDWLGKPYEYTAEQMRAYARAALQSRPSFPVQAEAPQITGGWTSGTVQGSK